MKNKMSSLQNDYSDLIDDSIDQTIDIDFPVKRLLSKSTPKLEQKVAVVEKVDVAESSPPETPKKKTKTIKVLRKKKVAVPIIKEPEVECKAEVENESKIEPEPEVEMETKAEKVDATSFVKVKTFIKNHYAESGSHKSHCSMGQLRGNFFIGRNDLDNFFDSFCNTVYNDESPNVGIAELPQNYTPVLVDIDIKLPYQGNYFNFAHLYDDDSVLAVITAYNSVLREIVSDITDDHLTCILLEKPIYAIEQGGNMWVKNGFHLHYPKLFLDRVKQKDILLPRVRAIVSENQVFSYLGFNDSGKIVDSVEDKPWLMYKSQKDIDMPYYSVSKVFNCNLEEMTLEQAFENYKVFDKNEMPINIKNNIQFYLPRILSILPYGRDVMEIKVSESTVAKTEAKSTRFLRQTEYDEDGEPKYKSDPDGDLAKARKLLPMLKTSRAVEYQDWIRVMYVLMNISKKTDEALELFLEFSARAENYDEDGCILKWNSTPYIEVDDKSQSKHTLGSLIMWAKEDSPELYKKFELNHCEHIIERLKYACIYGSHSDYAEFFQYLYGDKYIRILNQNPVKMKFASWNENRSLWVIEEKSVLSRLIRSSLKPIFEKWYTEQSNKIATTEDGADKDSITGLLKLIKKVLFNLSSKPFLNNIVDYYCSFDIDKTFESKLNSKKDCLPIKNKLAINLKTKEIYERTIDDLFSVELDVEYVTDCKYDNNVIPFFSDICCGDNDLIDYHKRFWGYSMTGEISDRSVHMFWGNGRNGKSTLIELFQKIMGEEYFKACSEKVMMATDQSSSTAPELTRLRSARFAVLSETGKTEELNSTRIKTLTGGDNIVARGLYQDEIQFKLQANFAILTNNKPNFDVKDQAMIDRIKLVPFLARFENTPENRDYINELMTTCLDEFFSWFVDGAYEWYNGKSLVPCKVMDHEMSAYINELDIQSQFMEERIEVITKEEYNKLSNTDKALFRTKKDSLFAMFMSYVVELGVKPKFSKNDFYKGLEKYNIESITVKGIRFFICKQKQLRVDEDE